MLGHLRNLQIVLPFPIYTLFYLPIFNSFLKVELQTRLFDCFYQETAHFPYKVPGSKYFQFWRPHGFCLSFPGGSDGKESAWNAGNLGSIPGLERSSGGGNGSPLQYSCLENSMDRGVRHDWVTNTYMWFWSQILNCHSSVKGWQPIPVFLPGESQGRGSLVGCHLWGHTESDTTEVT